jgi:hypothetical protein
MKPGADTRFDAQVFYHIGSTLAKKVHADAKQQQVNNAWNEDPLP